MDLEDQQEESSDISDETKVDQESAINLINAIDPKHREHLCQVWSLELPLPNKLVDGKLENVLLPSRYRSTLLLLIFHRNSAGDGKESSLEATANSAFKAYTSLYDYNTTNYHADIMEAKQCA